MTKTLEAGPEFDAQVVAEVMEWLHWEHGTRFPDVPCWRIEAYTGDGYPRPCLVVYDISRRRFEPSADWSAAGEVLEKLTAKRWTVVVSFAHGRWVCNLPGYIASAETAPLAICLAALEAVRKGKGDDHAET